MPVTRVDATGVSTSSGTATTVTTPVHQSGDVLLCFFAVSETPTLPTGWTTDWRRIALRSVTNTRHEVWLRVADGTEPSSYTFTGGGYRTYVMAAYRGVDAANPVGYPIYHNSGNSGADTTFVAPPAHLHSATKVVGYFSSEWQSSAFEQIGAPAGMSVAWQGPAFNFDVTLCDGDFAAGTTGVLTPTRTKQPSWPFGLSFPLVPADRPWNKVTWWDFSTHTTDANPYGLHNDWYAPSRTDTIVASGTDKASSLRVTTTERYLQNAAAAGVDLAAPFELTAKLRATEGTSHRLYLNFCAAGTTGSSRNGYYTHLDATAGTFQLSRLTADAGTALGNTGVAGANNTWYWVRVRHTGTRIYVKVWTDGTTEPAAWHIDIADATYTTGMWGPGGRVAAHTVETDALGLSLDPTTHAAPTSGPVAPATVETVFLPGIGTAQALGAATLEPGTATTTPPDLPSGEAVAPASLAPQQTLTPAGLTTAEALVAAVLVEAQALNLPSLGTAEGTGSVTLILGGVLAPPGLPSGETVAPASLAVVVTLPSLPSGENVAAVALVLSPPPYIPPPPPVGVPPPTPLPRPLVYQVFTTDLLTGRRLCHALPITVSGFTRGLFGSPGTLSGTVPLDAPEDPVPLLRPRRTAIWVEVNGSLEWGGIVMPVEPDIESGTLNVQATQFFSYFARREIRGTHKFNDRPDVLIARDLIGFTAVEYTIPISVSVNITGTATDITYPGEEATSVAQAIMDLADADPGFDIAEDYYYTRHGTPRTRLLVGKVGTRHYSGTLDYPGNVVTYRWPVDPANAVNSFMSVGKGSKRIVARDWNELHAGYPSWQGNSGGDYTNITSRSLLLRLATARVKEATGDRVVPVFTVRADTDPRFGTYREGDSIRARLTSAYHREKPNGAPGYDGWVRMLGLDVAPEDGTVTITCQEVRA